MKLNAARGCCAAASWSCATEGLAIGIDPEEHLPVLDGVRVLNSDFLDHAGELRLDLVHDLHRLDDAEDLPFGDAWPTATYGLAPGSGAA